MKKQGELFYVVNDEVVEKVLIDENEWVGMPEFVQEAKKPYAQIIFRFSNEADLQEFSRLIGQKLTRKTKSAWHPKMIRGKDAIKRYENES